MAKKQSQAQPEQKPGAIFEPPPKIVIPVEPEEPSQQKVETPKKTEIEPLHDLQVPDNRLPTPELSEEDSLVKRLAKEQRLRQEEASSLEPVTLSDEIDHSISYFKRGTKNPMPDQSNAWIRAAVITVLGLAVIAVGLLAWIKLKPPSQQALLDQAVINMLAAPYKEIGFSLEGIGWLKIDDARVKIDSVEMRLEADISLSVADNDIARSQIRVKVIATEQKWYFKLIDWQDFIKAHRQTIDQLPLSTQELPSEHLLSLAPSIDNQWFALDRDSILDLIEMVPSDLIDTAMIPEFSLGSILSEDVLGAISDAYPTYPAFKLIDRNDETASEELESETLSIGLDYPLGQELLSVISKSHANSIIEMLWRNLIRVASLDDENVIKLSDNQKNIAFWQSDTGNLLLELTLGFDGSDAKWTDVPDSAERLEQSVWANPIVALLSARISGDEQETASVEMRSDIDSLYTALEDYYNQMGYYPLPNQVLNLAWVEVNLEGASAQILIDPSGIEIGDQEAAYYYNPFGCTAGGCRSFVVGTTLPDGTTYEKLSING